MDAWVPLVAAAIGAFAGLSGAWLVSRGQLRQAQHVELRDAYAAVMATGHAIELHLADPHFGDVPAHLKREAAVALATVALLAPYDTHRAVDEWVGRLARGEAAVEYVKDDVTSNIARWETALRLMRRDVGT